MVLAHFDDFGERELASPRVAIVVAAHGMRRRDSLQLLEHVAASRCRRHGR